MERNNGTKKFFFIGNDFSHVFYSKNQGKDYTLATNTCAPGKVCGRSKIVPTPFFCLTDSQATTHRWLGLVGILFFVFFSCVIFLLFLSQASTRLGCGMARCDNLKVGTATWKDGYYLVSDFSHAYFQAPHKVCNYAPAGNYTGQTPYVADSTSKMKSKVASLPPVTTETSFFVSSCALFLKYFFCQIVGL
jgi:hypothetical protein